MTNPVAVDGPSTGSAAAPPVHVVELAVPGPDDLQAATSADGVLHPSWIFRGIKEAVRTEQLDLLGHTDFVTPEVSSIARFPLQEYRHLRYLVALSAPPVGSTGTSPLGLPLLPTVAVPGAPAGDPSTVLGYVLALASKTDNTHLLELDGAIHPDHVDSGADEALWEQTLRLAGELRRRTVITYQSQRIDGVEDASDLLSPTGFGRLHRDRAVATQLARGFELQQCERLSMQIVPDDAVIDAWIDAARSRAGDAYRTTVWHGPTPQELQDDLAELFRRMSIDVPIGELEYE